MRLFLPLSVVVLLTASSCVVVDNQCNPRNCNGCCSSSGQCVDGNSTSSCGNGGNACSVCPGTFTCSLGTCQPGSSTGGGFGGGTGGGLGGGTGGGFGGGTGGGLGGGTGGGGTGLASGNIIFLWNFDGQTCAQTPSVQSVRVTIPGQTLMNGGVFQCSNGGSDGIQLLNFAGGQYAYTLEALSASNVVLYARSGNLTVNGTVQINATLNAVSSTPGSVGVSWTFPPNSSSSMPTCTQAGVSEVVVTIDATSQTVPCAQGYGTAQVIFSNLTQGNHAITLAARDTNQFVYYDAAGTFMASAGNRPSLSFTMGWAVGGLPVKWSFSNGASQLNCAQAGATTMNVNLRDSSGTLVYGTTGVDVPCSDNGVQGTNFPFLNGGAYDVFLQAYGTASVLYRSNFTTPPSVTVVNGQFPVIDNSTVTVLLTP